MNIFKRRKFKAKDPFHSELWKGFMIGWPILVLLVLAMQFSIFAGALCILLILAWFRSTSMEQPSSSVVTDLEIENQLEQELGVDPEA